MPLRLTFINLRKAFDSVETEAVIKALGNQGVHSVHEDAELYSNFTARISSFYKGVIIDVKKWVG